MSKMYAAAIAAFLVVGATSGSALADQTGVQTAAGTWTTTTNGCKVWNPAPEPNETVDWSGDCVDGFANGAGTVTWFKHGKRSNRITGTWLAGREQGEVRIEYPSGSIYVGKLNDSGLMEGRGTMIYASGSRYEGEFKNGVREGRGTYWDQHGGRYNPKGGVYVGEFRAGMINGRGVYRFSDGSSYDGEWKNNKRSGFGSFYNTSGQIDQQGIWNDNKFIVACNNICTDTYGPMLPGQPPIAVSAAGAAQPIMPMGLAFIRRQAEAGDPAAQYELGRRYEQGNGVPQNYVQAHLWLNLSAASATDPQARDAAAKDRDAIAAKMTPGQIEEAQRLAAEWKPTAP